MQGTVVQHFVGAGISVVKGCEVMVDRVWLAELPAGEGPCPNGLACPTATGILIDGNDHDVTNVVVWSMLIGLHIKSGGDTMVTGVHNWYPGNIELEIPGQVLYLTEAGSCRFDSCMIDNGKAVFQNGGMSDNMWVNGLEYSDHDVGTPHGIMLVGDSINNFIVQRVRFDHAARIYHVGSATPKVTNTLIMDNMGPGIQASRASLSVKSATPQKSWTFNFTSSLLFPIDHVRVVTASGGMDCAVATTTFAWKQLTVETAGPVTSVFAEVDSSAFTSGYA